MRTSCSTAISARFSLILSGCFLVASGTGIQGQSLVMGFPNLTSGTRNVVPTAPIIFTFLSPMTPSGTLDWNVNVDATKVAYSWNSNATALTCTYTPGWPPNSTISWSMQTSKFKGADGSPLLAPVSGWFSSGTGTGTTNPISDQASDPNQGFYVIGKALQYIQTDSANVVPGTAGNAAAFSAFLKASAKNRVSSGFVVSPDKSRHELLGYLDQSFTLKTTAAYASQAELDAAYPAGAYQIDWQLDTGVYGSSVTMPLLNENYPSMPKILNFDQIGSLDPSQDFLLQFAPFTGATDRDAVMFTITDTTGMVFQTPEVKAGRTLSALATSLTIPKGTLRTNTPYQATLSFIRVTVNDNASMAYSVGLGCLSRTLQFNMKITGGGVRPVVAQFSCPKRLADGSVQLQFTGQTHVTYQLEYSPDLRTWSSLVTSNAATGVIDFNDSLSSTTQRRFYRAKTTGQ